MSYIRHLYSSRVSVLRLSEDLINGAPVTNWYKIDSLVDPELGVIGEMKCRLDIGFLRPGRDTVMPITAGRAPDRVGLMFCDITRNLKAGDRIKTISGPVFGMFELRTVPDIAIDFDSGHHLEIPLWEVSQSMDWESPRQFPGALPME